MRFTSIVALAMSLTAVIAIPVAEPLPGDLLDAREAEPVAVAVADDEWDDDLLPSTLEARGLTRAQCKLACDKGADAVEAFCRKLPVKDLRVRAACWAASTAIQSPLGQRACIAFCDNYF